MSEYDADRYLDALSLEIERRCNGEDIDTVFVGGGNPFALNPLQLERILGILPKAQEFSVECNPESLTKTKADIILKVGVNRVSLGLQSNDDDILKVVGRRHSYNDFLTAVKLLRERGLSNINADIMLGLPNQTLDSVRETVARLVDLGVEHISAYSLKVEKGTPLYKSGYKPDEDLQADMYDSVCEALSKTNYNRYEVSNFARLGYECKHNLKYWTLEPYIGCGVSAHSLVGNIRISNTPNLTKYLNGNIVDTQTQADTDTERIMLGLRLTSGIPLNLVTHKQVQLDRLSKVNLITIKNNRVTIAKDKFYLSNAIIAELI